jgi:peptidoglycan/LPS O-acetylase OafA/YrhL
MNPTPQLREESSLAAPCNGSHFTRAADGVACPSAHLPRAVVTDIRQSVQVAAANGNKTQRLPALDFTKGALVLVMVLYHWLNYFVGPQGLFYVYLRFLPPSFICITGFLISHVYLSKYRITDARLPRRLAVRGLKILGMFVLLNAAISGLIRGSFDNFSVAVLESIYVSGNMASGRAVAFFVLVPIGYLLLLSAGLLIACRYFKPVFHLVCVLCLLAIFVLNLNGYKSGNLDLLTIGLLGISIGYLPMDKLNRAFRHPYTLMVAYLAYLAAITAWEVPYPLLIVGVLLTLMLIYLLGTVSGDAGRVQRSIILLGKYSLVGYIAQIAILQLLRRTLPMELTAWSLGASFVTAIALTLITVEAIDRARAKAPLVNRLYNAVFS